MSEKIRVQKNSRKTGGGAGSCTEKSGRENLKERALNYVCGIKQWLNRIRT